MNSREVGGSLGLGSLFLLSFPCSRTFLLSASCSSVFSKQDNSRGTHKFLARGEKKDEKGWNVICILSLKSYIKTQQVKHECCMENAFDGGKPVQP